MWDAVPEINTYLENTAGIVNGYRGKKQTQPNLLECISFICCDARLRNPPSAKASGYLLNYKRSEKGVEPNIRK